MGGFTDYYEEIMKHYARPGGPLDTTRNERAYIEGLIAGFTKKDSSSPSFEQGSEEARYFSDGLMCGLGIEDEAEFRRELDHLNETVRSKQNSIRRLIKSFSIAKYI